MSRLVQCVECGLIFDNPRPELADLAAQYEQSYFHCSQPTFGGDEDYEADREDVLRTFRRRLVSMRPLVPGAEPRLLDVGCATGIFLEAAAAAGWKAEGIDISAYAVSVPAAFLEECERILRPGGRLAISTPDAGSPPAGVLKGRWLGFRSTDEHLYCFSRRTMTAMLGSVDRMMPRHSIYINPLDTMSVLAVKGRRTAP